VFFCGECHLFNWGNFQPLKGGQDYGGGVSQGDRAIFFKGAKGEAGGRQKFWLGNSRNFTGRATIKRGGGFS